MSGKYGYHLGRKYWNVRDNKGRFDERMGSAIAKMVKVSNLKLPTIQGDYTATEKKNLRSQRRKIGQKMLDNGYSKEVVKGALSRPPMDWPDPKSIKPARENASWSNASTPPGGAKTSRADIEQAVNTGRISTRQAAILSAGDSKSPTVAQAQQQYETAQRNVQMAHDALRRLRGQGAPAKDQMAQEKVIRDAEAFERRKRNELARAVVQEGRESGASDDIVKNSSTADLKKVVMGEKPGDDAMKAAAKAELKRRGDTSIPGSEVEDAAKKLNKEVPAAPGVVKTAPTDKALSTSSKYKLSGKPQEVTVDGEVIGYLSKGKVGGPVMNGRINVGWQTESSGWLMFNKNGSRIQGQFLTEATKADALAALQAKTAPKSSDRAQTKVETLTTSSSTRSLRLT